MGIKNLNRFLLDNCSTYSIRKMYLSEFSGKTVVVDTSIYLYKYVEKDALIENLYLMISKMLHYNIIPVFIFDGKPPSEKKELIEKRKMDKKIAEEKYNQLKRMMQDESIRLDPVRLAEIKLEMELLKKQFVRIRETDFITAKSIFSAFGIQYFESRGEADHLCAYLVKHNYAWACLSDDMDMFLYECPRVLRHMSLFQDTVIYYNTTNILKELDMTPCDFKSIMIISGTDYNIGDDLPHLYDVVDLYCQYRKYCKIHFNNANLKPHTYPGDVRKIQDISNNMVKQYAFMDWLIDTSATIIDKEKINKVRVMFDLSIFALNHNDELQNIICQYPFQIKSKNNSVLKEILENDGFIIV